VHDPLDHALVAAVGGPGAVDVSVMSSSQLDDGVTAVAETRRFLGSNVRYICAGCYI
jgi:hypothetical protein